MNYLEHESNLSHYLILTPYYLQNDANYSGNLTYNFFNENFLLRTKTFDQLIAQVTNSILSNEASYIFKIVGNAHCGKTTFTYTLKNNFENNYKNVGFDIIEFDFANTEPNSTEANYAIIDNLRRKIVSILLNDES